MAARLPHRGLRRRPRRPLSDPRRGSGPRACPRHRGRGSACSSRRPGPALDGGLQLLGLRPYRRGARRQPLCRQAVAFQVTAPATGAPTRATLQPCTGRSSRSPRRATPRLWATRRRPQRGSTRRWARLPSSSSQAWAAFLGREKAFAAAFVGWKPAARRSFRGRRPQRRVDDGPRPGALAVGAAGGGSGRARRGSARSRSSGWRSSSCLCEARGARPGPSGRAPRLRRSSSGCRGGCDLAVRQRLARALGPLAENVAKGRTTASPRGSPRLVSPTTRRSRSSPFSSRSAYPPQASRVRRGAAKSQAPALCAELLLLATPWLIAWYAGMGRYRSPPWRRTGQPGSSRSALRAWSSAPERGAPIAFRGETRPTKPYPSVAEAQRLVLEARTRARSRARSGRARGRPSPGRDRAALVDLPPFPSSAMDGFAVRAGTPARRAPARRGANRGRIAGASARSRRARRWRSRPAAPSRKGRTRSSHSSSSRIRATRSRSGRRWLPARTFGSAEAMCGRATRSRAWDAPWPGPGRRARGRRDPRGAVREETACRDPRHRHRS